MKVLLYFLTILISFPVLGDDINYQKLKELYPKADYVIFNKEVSISYFINKETGLLNAKSLHNITVVSLKDNCDFLQCIQLPFNEFENLNVLFAKILKIDSLGQQNLAENIKVKFLKSRDYFISGILYHDLKVKEITPTVSIQEKMIVNYSYEYIYADTKFLNTFPIQDENEDVVHYKFTLNIPEYVKARLFSFNISDTLNIKERNENSNRILEYRADDIKSKITHDYSPSVGYYSPVFLITTQNFINQGKTLNILASLNDLYTWYNTLINELKPEKATIEKLANEIVKGKSTPIEKLEAIFKYVQKNIHYVAFEDGIAGFKPKEANKVIELKYGDCKGMANTLVELLRAAGFNACHTWIGTRHLNFPLTTNSLAANNHMICSVFLNNQVYYLDPTDKDAVWNKIPGHLQGKEALIGKGNDFEVKTLPEISYNDNITQIKFNCSLDNNLQRLKAKADIQLMGEDAFSFYSYYNHSGSSSRKEIKSYFKNYFLQHFRTDSSSLSQPVSIEAKNVEAVFKGELPGAIVGDGKKVFVFLDHVPFLGEITVGQYGTPVSFNYRKKIIVTYSISVPSSVKNVKLPASKEIVSSDKKLICKTHYEKMNNQINVTREIIIDSLLLDFSNSENLVNTLEELRKEECSPIIFSL